MGQDSGTTSAERAPASAIPGLTGFFKRLAQYYAEFLSTDFKKQRLPRRRLETSDAKGRLVGIPLRKYPGFQQKLWRDLTDSIGTGLSLIISRGTWRASLPPAIMGSIAAHIVQVGQKDADAVISTVMERACALAEEKGDDPEIAFEQFVEEIRASLARIIIAPLLERMDGFFARTEHKPFESLQELEGELSARLANSAELGLGAAFSTLLVKGDDERLATELQDQLALDLLKAELPVLHLAPRKLARVPRISRAIECLSPFVLRSEHCEPQFLPRGIPPLPCRRGTAGSTHWHGSTNTPSRE